MVAEAVGKMAGECGVCGGELDELADWGCCVNLDYWRRELRLRFLCLGCLAAEEAGSGAAVH